MRGGRPRGESRAVKRLLELLGLIALVQGVLGLVHEFTHWHVGLVQRLGFLDGYEVYVSIALVVLAFALFAVAESRGSE
ncbi:hypothetical protein Scel_09600 [Streptomyces cellostaticus]|nr:hypothetical protein Scel_09600 [Streptomyces cellostaticus]